jgi:hypothetical protein
MRILIGILYCIEKEFEKCIESIENQTFKEVDVFVIKGMPNKIAHDQLYSRFMEKANSYDLFVKIDADMVLIDNTFLSKVVKKFNQNKFLEHLEIAVHDFFSDQLIWGLHIYRNTVKWKKNNEELFTDLVPMNIHHKLVDDSNLAPAALHCMNPGGFQSFHYGVHKAIKIMQPDRKEKKSEHAVYHWNIIQKTWKNYLRSKDLRIVYALLGSELAFKNKLKALHLDYNNTYCLELYKNLNNYSHDRIFKDLKRLKLFNWGIFPEKYRFRVLRYLEGGHMLQISSWPKLVKGFISYIQENKDWLILKDR